MEMLAEEGHWGSKSWTRSEGHFDRIHPRLPIRSHFYNLSVWHTDALSLVPKKAICHYDGQRAPASRSGQSQVFRVDSECTIRYVLYARLSKHTQP